jgi:hypothetical protein
VIPKRLSFLLAAVALSACESTMPYAWVATEVKASPRYVLPGHVVELEVAATNWGEETVFASNGCAPGLGFMVTRPDLEHVNPYPASWPCAVEDTHALEPGETDTVVFQWTVPNLTGEYQVVGGLVVEDRLWSVSPEVAFEVRSGP